MNALYIHIPFCNSICSYCDFPKQIAKEEVKKEYLNHLFEELAGYEKMDWFQTWSKHTESVYFGGGTPNCLSIEMLEHLFKRLSPYLMNSKENTIEINSEALTLEQVKLFKKYHINRVSIGVQSFFPKHIHLLRRGHTEKTVKEAIRLLKSEAINNINIDMMYGLPSQTMDDLKKDIDILLSLDVAHISYYSLILEEKTILSYQVKHHQISLPEDDLVADMADYLTQRLKMALFKHYEVSNYAKDGYSSIHNLTYWNYEEYIGIGSSACSLYHNQRIQNAFSLKHYYMHEYEEVTELSIEDRKAEFMMMGLRKLEGIKIEEYYRRFKTYPKDDFDLVSLEKKGLIEELNGFIRIKEDKIWLGNLVFECFIGGKKE